MGIEWGVDWGIVCACALTQIQNFGLPRQFGVLIDEMTIWDWTDHEIKQPHCQQGVASNNERMSGPSEI